MNKRAKLYNTKYWIAGKDLDSVVQIINLQTKRVFYRYVHNNDSIITTRELPIEVFIKVYKPYKTMNILYGENK